MVDPDRRRSSRLAPRRASRLVFFWIRGFHLRDIATAQGRNNHTVQSNCRATHLQHQLRRHDVRRRSNAADFEFVRRRQLTFPIAARCLIR